MQPDVLDEHRDVGLCAAQRQLEAGLAQAPRDHHEVEHQRGVGERQPGEIDDDIRGRAQRLRQRLTPPRLRRTILIPIAPQRRRIVLVRDDGSSKPFVASPTRDTITRMATLQEIEEALTNVIDPELGLDFVELGLIYGIQQDSGNVMVTFTLTTPACPIGPQITEQIEEFVLPLEGVESVKSEMTFEPPWSPEKMSEDAKFALGF